MTDLDRRSMLKLALGHAVAGASFAVAASCSRDGSVLDPRESTPSADLAGTADEFERTVRAIVLSDFHGVRLKTCPPRVLDGFLVDAGHTGWDVAGVAHGFNVSPPSDDGRGSLVNVTFRMMGRLTTDGFRPTTSDIEHAYRLTSRSGQSCIVYEHEPIVARSVAATHLRRLLQQRFKIEAGRETLLRTLQDLTAA